MPGATPHFSWPYQLLSDPPDGSGLGEDLGTAIDTKVYAMDTTPDQQIFTASGTWTKPANAKWVRIQCQGAGGGGGGAPATAGATVSGSSGGEAGSYTESLLAASSLSATETVTIGAAGAGVSGTDGTNGGDSLFGSLLEAEGGDGGVATTAAGTIGFTSGINTGQTMTGQLQIGGGGSAYGGRLGSADACAGGGGNSVLGHGGGGRAGSNSGHNARGYGGGGGGACNGNSQSARAGGNGTAGIIIVTTYFTG